MCELLSGHTNPCDNAGGVDTFYAFSTVDSAGLSNIQTLTVTAGAVTALTLKTGKFAYPINVAEESATFTEKSLGEKKNGSYAVETTATLPLIGNTAEMIVMVESMCKGRIGLIAKLNDGSYELMFVPKGGKANFERTPGTAYEDMNGNTITIVGKNTGKSPKISSVIVEALLSA